MDINHPLALGPLIYSQCQVEGAHSVFLSFKPSHGAYPYLECLPQPGRAKTKSRRGDARDVEDNEPNESAKEQMSESANQRYVREDDSADSPIR